MVPITPICKLNARTAAGRAPSLAALVAVALAALAPGAAAARPAPVTASPLKAYARARLAGVDGDVAAASRSLAAVLAARPDDAAVAARAYRQALVAGDMALALRSAALLDKGGALPADGRLLLMAQAVRNRDWAAAQAAVDAAADDGSFDFLAPVLSAWIARGAGRDPFAILDAPTGSALTAALAAEHRALLLIAAGRVDEGEGIARTQALTGDGSGAFRLVAAARLQAAGRTQAALALLPGEDPVMVSARAAIAAGRPLDMGSSGPAGGIAQLLLRVGETVQADPRSPLALTLARLAHFLDPASPAAALTLARLLAVNGQRDAALAMLAPIVAAGAAAPLLAPAVDLKIAILAQSDRRDEALALAAERSRDPRAGIADHARLGDLLVELGREGEAVPAYRRAVTLAEAAAGSPAGERRWSLWLVLGSALERSGQWGEARAALEKAVQLAPLEPAALNYLGYAQLERRENVKAAMTLIERAASLRPDDPAITDSLGWAYFLIGDLAQAIPALERAVEGEPADPTINEHLGDAYWAAGRRFEARHAWRAAALFADSPAVAERATAKIDRGFSDALAAR
ncbi:tetratricopeptide repeat protein [Sphingomonas changnyeongensis]|uniref:Tetratricopeptide repeat protein n=1 Tax=Sphingomonas changnyeongensis TaxID=2698679 RepID=A0A7Z2NWQ5_9SPHN|nr:tetratricopeptide repeat protein [Sphingomonas changnyeongensis]QHL90804.1 tetratricopeptide repeat protein [Sphingomonas changnyeongensis]